MKPDPRSRGAFAMVLSTLLTLACLSCTDRNPNAPEVAVAMEVTPVLRCTVDVRSGTVSCTEEGPTTANGASYALLGNASVKLRSANNSYDSLSLVYGFDVTVQNLLSYAIGTPDGQIRAGLKVFFERVPYVTAYKTPGDTGTVILTNHDGTQNFTGAAQPYFLFDTILPPQAVTNVKRWQFRVPRSVQSFGFSVRVFTATTTEQKVPLTAPNSRPSWFNSPASLIRYGDSQIMLVKNVVRVEFRPDASQEERQSAVDMVGGSVVGGGAGFYYVRVPSNGTLPSLESYFVTLSRLPQVRSATPFITSGAIEVSYQKAYDTVGWREWQLNPDSANNQNWALERIGAPFAWGCSCGDTLTTGRGDRPGVSCAARPSG
ncbi:hypothetical protein [Longimicrobium sp.]|uniref:hypothetical protein n=1 Tax=Longimicrobium sp. TaxID=2029185 RepID=UPI003B3AEF0D